MARKTFFLENKYTTSLAGRLYRNEFIVQLITDLPDAFRVCGLDMLKAGFERTHLHSLNYFDNIWNATFEEKLDIEVAFVGVGKWIGIMVKKQPNYIKELSKSLDNNFFKISFSSNYWLLEIGESILEFLELITKKSEEKKMRIPKTI